MKPLRELTTDELLALQKTGADASNFLSNNEFYVKHLAPALKGQAEAAKISGEWKPGRTCDTAENLLYNAYNSGKGDGLKEINSICLAIAKRGESATAELAKRAQPRINEANRGR